MLPEGSEVTFVGTEEDVPKARALLDAKVLGVDCEWRPGLIKFHKTRVGLLQIGDDGPAGLFLIDMIALSNSQALDEILTEVFSSHNIGILGMSFHNDLQMLGQSCKEMNFYKHIECLYDVQTMFETIYKKKKGQGLDKICTKLLGKRVCKGEQTSNWERRPLRQSQTHYAALDAYILVKLYEK